MPEKINLISRVHELRGWEAKKKTSRQRFFSPPHFSDLVDELHIVRDGNRSQDADDEQHYQKLRQGKALRLV
jgi:hypothetical protein